MTNVTILSIYRRHAQNEYRKFLEMKNTFILTILALSPFWFFNVFTIELVKMEPGIKT